MSLREQWKHFASVPIGRRFVTRYREQRGRHGGLVRKLLIAGAGALLMLAGIAMLVLPGPGLLALVLGAALVAEESHLAARLLDRIDAWRWHVQRRWRERRRHRRRSGVDD